MDEPPPGGVSGGTPWTWPGLPLEDLRPARGWRPGRARLSGLWANQRICAAYQALDPWVERYLGTPRQSSWVTFAKYSSAFFWSNFG